MFRETTVKQHIQNSTGTNTKRVGTKRDGASEGGGPEVVLVFWGSYVGAYPRICAPLERTLRVLARGPYSRTERG